MAKYKVLMHYPDGSSEEEDEVFETESQAEAHGSYMCSCCAEGQEVLNLSNPGDYPFENADSAHYEVIEISD